MTQIKHIVLDVLKPHHPNVVEFARAIAEKGADYRVDITVEAVDEKTETVLIHIHGGDIAFEVVAEVIAALGGSIHSIDQVEVAGRPVSA